MADTNSIFILGPNWVGDFAMATPVFRAIRGKFPQAHITIGMRPPFRQLIEGSPWCDEIFLYDKKKYRGISGWWRLRQMLRQRRYDLVVLLPNSIRSGLVGWLTGAKARIGYSRPGDWLLLTHKLSREREGGNFRILYTGEYYARLMRLLDVELTAEDLQLELPLDEITRGEAREIWDKCAGEKRAVKILFAPGAAFGSSKMWPVEHFATLIDMLWKEQRAKMLIAPGPGEELLVEKIGQLADHEIAVQAPSAEGLRLLKGLIAEADVVLCNDSGARHIAHAFRTPSVVMMGPTDPAHTYTKLERSVILRHPIECSPCYLKICPFSHHGCMVGITPERVYQTTIEVLEKAQSG